jgi:DNA ligase-1
MEGVMININEAPYCFKRTDNLLKLKVMKSCDLKVIGFEEGEGKNTGVLGALIVDYKGFPLKVGSGYSDSYRSKFWDNKEKLIGLTIEVQYFEETKNKEGELSLRFPVFLRVRSDK